MSGALMEKILPLLAAAGGRTFLLFTSHRALQAAARWLRSNSDYNLFVQQDAPRQVLLSRFAKTPRSLLLGAASFWEGVDVPGKALSRSVEHTSELQSRGHLVCRLLLEKKKRIH